MAVYFILDVQINDPETYATYRQLVPPTLEKYGGRLLIRGGATQFIEGNWGPGRVVVVEFKNEEQFRHWYDSPEYAPAKKLRLQASKARAILVQGA